VEHRQLVLTGRRAVYTDMFNRVKALQLAGHGVTAIVRQTRFNWRTVTRWMRLDALPERNVLAPKPNTPSGFRDHLSRGWAEGCTSGRALLLEIRDLGYTGSLSHLGRLLAGWRRAGHPVTVDAITAAAPLLIDPLTGHLVSSIVAAALCVKAAWVADGRPGGKGRCVQDNISGIRHDAGVGHALPWHSAWRRRRKAHRLAP
jgi:hypothetical protein